MKTSNQQGTAFRPSAFRQPESRPTRFAWPACRAFGFRLAACGLLFSAAAGAQKVSFRQAMDLAMQHSAGMCVAVADQMRAHQGYLETRNSFIPQIAMGSGLAETWGYPMSIEGSAPSAFNITAQSYLINFAQREFMKAAHLDWDSSAESLEDRRQATLLEAALLYVELAQIDAKLKVLQEESAEASRLEEISRQRLQEGVDSKLDLTQASLSGARIRLRTAETGGNADVLRQRLAQLTGLDAHELETDPSTIPPRPPDPCDPQSARPSPETGASSGAEPGACRALADRDLVAKALDHSSAVRAATEKAKASELRARGEHKQLLPAIDFVANYGLFTTYNNLDLLFPSGKFSRNNATVGVDIRIPFLSIAQRSRASVADAEALKAEKEAQIAREQVASDALKLQRTVLQLGAAHDVAKLELELAQAQSDATADKIVAGTATIKDQENARMSAKDKEAALSDAAFELDRGRLELLRITGDLEKWALQ
jgi:outer membrane protein TolC